MEWVTRRDVDLARKVSEIAVEQAVSADPRSITAIELGLDAARMAQMWVALLTGGIDARGRGTVGDDVRDATGRVPILCFQETDEHATPRQRFSLDVWVGPGSPTSGSLRRRRRRDDRGRQPGALLPGHRRPGRQQGVPVHVASSGVMPIAAHGSSGETRSDPRLSRMSGCGRDG